jgi:class 3 adenylate cyclase
MDVAATAARDDSAYSLPEDLRRPGLLGRFPPETESAYKTWFINQARPLIRIVAAVSLVTWIPMPFLVDLWVDSSYDASGVYIMAWAIAVPTLSALILLSYSAREALLIPAAGVGVLVIATISCYGFYNFMEVPLEAGLLGIIVWLNTLIPFVRAPFRLTLFLTNAITGVGTGFLVAAIDELHTPRAETWPDYALIQVVVLTVPLMSLVGEQAMRKKYVDEQVIERQQAELAAAHDLIRRYAPAAVAERLEHGDDTVGTAQRRRVTIFFADVVGFTVMADRLDPEALAEIMNDYLGSVADIVERHGGTLNEFAGDGVMAIFGAPDEMEPAAQVLAALAAADELQQSLPEWSQRWYSLGIDRDLQARIGINTGVVSVGTFGSAVRATYTGIGLQTNIAARVQSRCPPGSVLLSGTSWHLVKDELPCEPRGEVDVKGVHFPIAMYEPSDVGGRV